MNATELRIGNLIDSYHGIVPITGIKDGIIYHAENKIGATHGGILTSIPLTEEWLLKLGFDISDDDSGFSENDEGGKKVYRNKISIINDNGFALRIYIDGDSWYSFNWTKVNFVHQLQNLYFALTSEELEVK